MRIAFRMTVCLVLVLIANAYAAEKPLPGLLVVNLTVKDQAKFKEYGAKSRPILTAHKGTFQFRGTNPTVLFGEHKHKVLIGFKLRHLSRKAKSS